MKEITIPNTKPTHKIHDTNVVAGLFLDSSGRVVSKFELQPNETISVEENISSVEVLNSKSDLNNHQVHPVYKNNLNTDLTLQGAKDHKIEEIKRRAKIILRKTDWYVVRNQENNQKMPQEIIDHRENVRSLSDQFESDVNALESVGEVLNYEYSFPDPPQP